MVCSNIVWDVWRHMGRDLGLWLHEAHFKHFQIPSFCLTVTSQFDILSGMTFFFLQSRQVVMKVEFNNSFLQTDFWALFPPSLPFIHCALDIVQYLSYTGVGNPLLYCTKFCEVWFLESCFMFPLGSCRISVFIWWLFCFFDWCITSFIKRITTTPMNTCKH